MSFLTPFFLFGAAAIAGPIIYHLIRKATRERTRFSSLMFLVPSPPRLSKRHRLEHILLLLLRCLALGLLVLGFARPFFRQTQLNDPTVAQPKRILVLVDVSASMRRAGLWDEARARVDAVIRRAGPADQVALYTFDRRATPLVPFEEWNRTAPGDRVALALGRLGGVSPGWMGTHLGNALITAAEALAENESKTAAGTAAAVHEGPREIVVVSDLQAGSRLDALQAYEWPKGIQLSVEPLKARNPTNAGVQLVADAPDSSRAVDAAVRVRVTNSSDAKREQFKVGWVRSDGSTEFASPAVDAYVPPGQSRVFAVPLAKGVTGVEQIALRGDDEDFDNTVYVIPPTQHKASVLWLGSEAEDDMRQPLFFLRRAFFDTPRLAVKIVAQSPRTPLAPEVLKAANLIFVSDALTPEVATALRQEVTNGKILVLLAKHAQAAATAGLLLEWPGLAMEEGRPGSYAMFGEIDFRHPLFAPFADPRFSDFTKIHIWKFRKLAITGLPNARIIAKFDSGDPALVETPLGKGKVFVLATGWHPEDSQMAVSTKFVPLLWSWLDLAGGISHAPAQYSIGDKIPLPAEHGAAAMRVPGAAAAVPVAAEATEFAETARPGIYDLALDARTERFAINLDANESRTAPLGLEELEELGLPVTRATVAPTPTAESKSLLQGVEAENRQKLWRWFIAATLAVLLFESALAGWTARKSVLQTEEAPT